MSDEFAGQVAIVTGGASGIGEATVKRLVAGGAKVAVLDVDGARAESVAKAIDPAGAKVVAVQVDISSEESVAKAVARAGELLGEPHILVNCAGITSAATVADTAPADWDRVQAINLRGTFLMLQAVIPLMTARGYGRIVTLASGAAVRPSPTRAAYSSSKAGVIALTRAAAAEVGRQGVTVNCVAPGVTETPMTIASFGSREALEAAVTGERTANVMGVVLDPDDIAYAIVFFASPASRRITGQTLHANAGSWMA